VVINLFSRKVVGWSMRGDLHRSLVIDALEMAWYQRRPEKGALIFHSDRGPRRGSSVATLVAVHGNLLARSYCGFVHLVQHFQSFFQVLLEVTAHECKDFEDDRITHGIEHLVPCLAIHDKLLGS